MRRVLGEPALTADELRADADRLRLLTEFRAAWAAGDHDAMTEVILAAIDLDWAEPTGPRLMDEIRGITTPADDRMSAADRAAHAAASHVRQYKAVA
ncbi:hypothetical protein [Streptomyces sp. NPDC056682]|uniref:hypothetical protein n=1 Tax=Streptomyces sp. NPDC056682 TaxID=3345909 RepID=UPI0036B1E2E1